MAQWRRFGVLGGSLALVAIAGAAGLRWSRSPAAPTPNVLIVLWDTVRADHMSLYGHDRPTTPHLEQLARESAVYERATAPGMWTVPSHGSLFTGLPVASHGAFVGWLWLDGHHLTLAEHLRDRGYRTFAWSANPYLSEHTNLLQGFETVRYAWRGEEAAKCAEATRRKAIPGDRSTEISPDWAPSGHGQGWPKHLVAFKDSAPIAAETFLGWVDQRGDAPFFAYLNLLEAHHPRVPSIEARRAVSDAATVDRALATDASLFRIMAAMEDRASFAPDELDAMRATYDATLWDLDRATATVLDGLAARGLLDDTVVIVTSDHGENLGERNLFDHRWDLHQTLTHVPLVVRYPARVAPRRVADPVSTGDLFGEILALAGVAPPRSGPPLHRLGERDRAFSELVAPTPRLPEIRAAFPDLSPRRWKTRFRSVIEGSHELLVGSDGSSGLYDLVADPTESRDLSASDPDRVAALRQALAAWERERPSYDPAARTAEDRPGTPMRPDPGLADQLRQLGYTEDEPPAPEAP